MTKLGRPAGLTLLGFFLAATTVVHINTLIVETDRYFDLYAGLPHHLVYARYAFSWLQRVAGMAAAVGLLKGREWSRKLTLVIGGITVLGLYWKHPPDAFYSHTQMLDSQLAPAMKMWGIGGVSFSAWAMPALIIYYLLEILFWGVVAYYLTRPRTRSFFR